MLAPAYAAHYSTPLLRALWCLDTALHQVPTGKVAEELRYAREAALSALTDDERRVYAERAPNEVVQAAHENSLHALALRPMEVCAMLGADLGSLRRWERAGLIVAWRHPLDQQDATKGGRGGKGRERRYLASHLVTFCVRHGIPVPPALLPGATVQDLPRTAFRAGKGTHKAKVRAQVAARRTPRALRKLAEDDDFRIKHLPR